MKKKYELTSETKEAHGEHAKAPESVAAQRFPALIVSSHAGGHWFESSSLHHI